MESFLPFSPFHFTKMSPLLSSPTSSSLSPLPLLLEHVLLVPNVYLLIACNYHHLNLASAHSANDYVGTTNGTTYHPKRAITFWSLVLPLFMCFFLLTVLAGLLAIVYLCFCMPMSDGTANASALTAKQKLSKTTKQGKLGAFQPKQSMGVIFLNEEIKAFQGGPSDGFPVKSGSNKVRGKRGKGGGSSGKRGFSGRSRRSGSQKRSSSRRNKTASSRGTKNMRKAAGKLGSGSRKTKSRSKRGKGLSKTKSAVVAKESELGRASYSFYRQFLKSVHTVKSVSEYRFLSADGKSRPGKSGPGKSGKGG